jgi:predicted aspartyl protease
MIDSARRTSVLLHAAIGFAIALLLSVAAHAAPAPVLAANDANDVVGLETLAKSAATPDERALAQGSALALRHQDAAAIAVLEPLTQNASDKDIRAAAYLALSAVTLRQGRYADSYRNSVAAKALRSKPFTIEENQDMDLAKSLEGEKPMTVRHQAAGRLAVTRDVAGLVRVAVAINGNSADAVFDSGAGFSTLSESCAKKLGLRILDRPTTVGSSSKDALATRVGVAERFQFGDAVLNNVVFLVLPDSDLTFGNGAYKIDAIVGLPVMEALGRVELAKEASGEALYYGHKPGARAAGNLILNGFLPIVLAEADGKAGLRLFLDTGATNTMLNSSAARDYPALTAAAMKDAATITGAGGSTKDDNAMTLPTLRLTIAGRVFNLVKVSMHSKLEPGHHGVIGQDILKQGKSWALDFETMSFTVDD